MTTGTISIGLSTSTREHIATGLSRLLADTYVLAVKTQFCHWNVTGPHFISLHTLFGEQYDALASAVDLLAERIRALGHPSPGSLKAFLTLTQIQELQQSMSSTDMLKALVSDHETIARSARELAKEIGDSGDEGTLNLLADRMEAHEGTAWFLRAHLG
jgi:starvation-inducible DNA-binding protein